MARAIWLRVPEISFRSVAETALSLAAVQFAMIGVAVAWVPETLARATVQTDELVNLRATLGMQCLDLIVARLKGTYSQIELAASAASQEACLRPIPPEAIRPPQNDPEFRAFLNEEYQAYLLGMQEYLNCLGREHESATKETNEVMARWLLWFGDDAAIHYDNREDKPRRRTSDEPR